MCLAVPGKLVETQSISDSRLGVVQFGGIKRSVFLDFVPEAQVGDYVLVHVGFAISRLDEEEAQRTYKLLEHIGMLETEDPAFAGEPDAAEALASIRGTDESLGTQDPVLAREPEPAEALASIRGTDAIR